MTATEISVRVARPDEADTVGACIHAAFAPYVPRMGKPPGPMLLDPAAFIAQGHVWVAQSRGEIVGVLVAYETEQGFYIDTVAALPATHGTGVGRALLEFAEREARRRSFDSLYLCTNARMTENQVLYPKIGYVEYDRRTQDGFDRVFYRKPL
jgi:GNAT superfamily N-acetyltransferase